MHDWSHVGKLLHDPEMELDSFVNGCSHGMDHQHWMFDYHLRCVFFVDLQRTMTFDVDLVEPGLLVEGGVLNQFALYFCFIFMLIVVIMFVGCLHVR
jgi:hypothetical protein